ncbi:MAG: chromosome segregation protein SMC [Euryarchaeota archaeon RBG_13_57_23]|nr:MAG: chromosome segregation protein SMC [Euryarchaeota archaeon RBG_13_57_23]
MYLKQIELENFKSFARKRRIPLLQGFTCVTGPNGAGKSNISDAILFVLGPKSSRVIRAGKLTDLIFNGGKDKKAAKECTVSLIFDNSDRLIPIDSETVKLTRTVRVSENNAEGYYSYFYVNDRKSSLGEFDNLLANARISADGYNFVQQGDITRITSMSNLERRRILDDIAGITKFDEEIQSAEKEKLVAEENIGRLAIILDEIKKQMRQLDTDRDGALKYKDLHDKHGVAQACLVVKRKESVDREISSLSEQVTNYTSEKEKAEKKQEELRQQLDAITSELTQVEQEINDRGGEEAKQIKEKIDNLRIEIARAKDAVSNSEEAIVNLKEVRKAQSEDIKAVEKDLVALEEKLAPFKEQLETKSKVLEKKRSQLTAHHDEISKSDSDLSNLQKEALSLSVEVTGKEEKLHALRLEQDRLDDRVQRLRIDIGNLEETKKTYEFELKDAEWSIKEIKSETKSSNQGTRKLQEEYQSKRNKERKLLDQYQDLDNAIKTLTREYNQMKAEAEAVDQVRRGYTNAVSTILDARDKGAIKGVHGTVAELAEVDEDYETAVNVAAGSRMQAIVVDSDAVAAECISYLKKSKIGRATFLPLNKMVDGRPRGKAILASKSSVGFAIDLVKFDEKYRTAFWFVLGDTVVVKNLEEARRLMGGIRLVTLDGELAEASGAMVGGTLDKNLVKIGAPSENKIEKKAAELRNAIEEAEKVQGELAQLKTDITQLEATIRDINTKDGGESVKVSTLEAKKKEFDVKLRSIEDELNAKNKDLSDALDLLERTKEDVGRFEKEIEGTKKKKEAKDKKLLEATPNELSKALKELEAEIFDLANEVAKFNSDIQTGTKQIEIVQARKAELETGIKGTDENMAAQKVKGKEGAENQEKMETELKALLKMERSMGDELNSLRTKRDALYKKKTDTDGNIDKAITKVQTSTDFVMSLQTKVAEAEKKLQESEAELTQYANVKLPDEMPSMEDLRITVADCERQMASLGAVNLKAIDDYEDRKQRFESLKQEIGQLEKQKTNLNKLVSELNDKKTIGFMKIFGGINENFKKVFAELSGGGDAELLLENEQVPLAGGLIMKARPRDKKGVRMEALSGGEKSLTALSFIMAIQSHQPSPFYLLDEVDMFLDGINAENVAKAVKRGSKNAQFIQISLRNVTLKESDHIIGVTMQHEGVSDIVMKPNIGEGTEEVPEEPPEQRMEGEAA